MVESDVLFIGLGHMGRPMATNIGGAGWPLHLYDVDHAAAETLANDIGAATVNDLTGVPRAIGYVVLMLPNSRIVESVLRGEAGLFGHLGRGTTVIDMSSSEPQSSVELAAEAKSLGISYVDAPVSGGVPKAETGELAIMAGGSDEDVAKARPLLETMGAAVVHVGPSGAGDAAKCLNNTLSAVNLASVAEVLSTATAFGIEPATMVKVINGATGRSQASEFKYPKYILSGTFDSGFAMDLMLKDLTIAADLMEAHHITNPVTSTARRVAAELREQLESEIPDHTELPKYYEIADGREFRGTYDD